LVLKKKIVKTKQNLFSLCLSFGNNLGGIISYLDILHPKRLSRMGVGCLDAS